jgi:hypothetical protein
MQPTNPSQPEESPRPAMHTFQSDLERAMDTTEASAVQELLQTARNKETFEIERHSVHRQRTWYSAGAVILVVLALGAVAFGLYYYRTLTVRVTPSPSVGVFQNLPSINTETTDVSTALKSLVTNESIPEGKPFLVPLTNNAGTALSPEATLSYLQVNPGEPFIATLSLVRLGAMNVGNSVSPFLILSTPNPELATKEFLIAEPKLLEMTALVLGIDLTMEARDIGTTFNSVYMYNLPVRTLTSTNVDSREETILMYYGYATDTTIVVATNPTVLKAIYDTIIRQR